jgi:protoporphyrinogen/coproporphyrinogen III oxidase
LDGEYEVIVVGGGISGLATCYYLQQLSRQARRNIHIILIESGSRLGGKILTDRINGMVIEGGPDSFFTQKPWALDLCKELDLSDRLLQADVKTRGTYILNHGKLTRLPQGTETGMPTKIWPFMGTDLISTTGKLRALMDLVIFRRSGNDDESVASFFTRRFGREFLEKIAEPLFAGIYAGDVHELSSKAVIPRLADLEQTHGSLIRGMMNERKKMKSSGPTPTFFTLKEGLVELVDGLVSHLDKPEILLNTKVAALSVPGLAGGDWLGVVLEDGRGIRANAVVLSTPAYITENLIRKVDEQSADLLATIPYVSTATVSMAFKEDDLGKKVEGHGFLVPRNENEIVTGCTWASSKWTGHAPPGMLLVRCFVGWAGHEEALQLDDTVMVQRIRDFLKRIADISAEPVLTHVYRWNKALPQYNIGHVERVEKFERAVSRMDGLFVTGAAYHGVGLPDCIHEAALTAQRVLKIAPKTV